MAVQVGGSQDEQVPGPDPDSSAPAHLPVPGDHPWLALLDRSPLGVLIHDASDAVLHVNEAFARLVDRPVEQIRGMPARELVHSADRDAHLQVKNQIVNGALDVATGDRRLIDSRGRPRWVRMFKSAVWHDGQRLVMLCVTDLQDWKLRMDRLNHAATHDELTGLLNRAGLAQQVARLPLTETPGRLAVLDLNGLKAVNDVHGHAAGDHVLRITAQLLQAASAPTWLIGRIGGDEFVVVDSQPVPEPVADRPHLLAIIDRALDTRVSVAPGVAHPMSASVGEVPFAAGDDFDDALRTADREMYRHKRSTSAATPKPALPRQDRRSGVWEVNTEELTLSNLEHRPR